MKTNRVAGVYGDALFEMAQEKGQLDSVQADFAGVTQTLREQRDLKTALTAYTFSIEERRKLAAEVADRAQLSPIVARFIDLLVLKNRLHLIEEIHAAFRARLDESRNVVRGTVTTVESLTGSEIEDLSRAFSKKMNKQAVLEPELDKSILGGLVVKIQGMTFDGSLKTTIRRLKENLEKQT